MVDHTRPQSGMFDSGGTGHPPRDAFLPVHRPGEEAPAVPVQQSAEDLPVPVVGEEVSE
ncbi:hypothetical protein [Kitasatospora sp. NPDC101183]|uniref:hypothetical protein n=1 Tax=Kitasatospora sp. NPDC101183 TaxID=3364100 RepID=UPI003818A5BB